MQIVSLSATAAIQILHSATRSSSNSAAFYGLLLGPHKENESQDDDSRLQKAVISMAIHLGTDLKLLSNIILLHQQIYPHLKAIGLFGNEKPVENVDFPLFIRVDLSNDSENMHSFQAFFQEKACELQFPINPIERICISTGFLSRLACDSFAYIREKEESTSKFLAQEGDESSFQAVVQEAFQEIASSQAIQSYEAFNAVHSRIRTLFG